MKEDMMSSIIVIKCSHSRCVIFVMNFIYLYVLLLNLTSPLHRAESLLTSWLSSAWSRKYLPFVKSKVLYLVYMITCASWIQSTPSDSISLWVILISSHLHLLLPNDLLPSDIPSTILCEFLIFVRTAWLTHLILLDLFIVIMFA